jgi:hypothetical protein
MLLAGFHHISTGWVGFSDNWLLTIVPQDVTETILECACAVNFILVKLTGLAVLVILWSFIQAYVCSCTFKQQQLMTVCSSWTMSIVAVETVIK